MACQKNNPNLSAHSDRSSYFAEKKEKNSNPSALAEPEPEDSSAPPPPPPSPPTTIDLRSNYTPTARKIIRTAQFKSKVAQVEQATARIEQISHKWNGYITANNLENHEIKNEETRISTDSMLQISLSQPSNKLTIRVPNQSLDTFLTELGRIVIRLDSRNVNSKDLTSEFLANQLKAQLRDQAARRIVTETDDKGKQLNDITAAETARYRRKPIWANAWVKKQNWTPKLVLSPS